MSDTNPVGGIPSDPAGQSDAQPLRDGDTSIEPDPGRDPAQAEWDRTTALDAGASPDELDETTATGDDPAMIPDELDEVPATDLPPESAQPESQGMSPLEAELGEEGEGDLSPEDLI
jgi:hypothetical protein